MFVYATTPLGRQIGDLEPETFHGFQPGWCGCTVRTDGRYLWRCTCTAGHPPPHIACYGDASICAIWSDGYPAELAVNDGL